MPAPLPDHRFLVLTIDLTDDNLRQMMRDMHPVVEQLKAPFIATIDGFGDDPRGLGDIPEVVEFFKRLIKLGFISLLEVTTLSSAVRHRFPFGGLGAFEIWGYANGIIKTSGSTAITRATWEQFFAELEECNTRCSQVTGIAPQKNQT